MTSFILASKVEIKESLGCSPDKADSAALLFTAVRELDQLNEYFISTHGDLTTSGTDYKQRESVPRNTPHRNPIDQVADVLAWMKKRHADN